MNKKIYAILGYMALAITPIYFLNHKSELNSFITSASVKSLIGYIPYICFGAVAFLGTRLNQTRVFFSSVFLLAFYHLGFFESFDSFFLIPKMTFFKAALFSTPLCMAAWLLCKESPLSDNKSLLRMFIGLSPIIITLTIGINDQDLFKLLLNLKKITSIDSYLISYTVFLIVALITTDKRINDYKISQIFSLIPIGSFAYLIAFAKPVKSINLYWSLSFSASAIILIYSLFKMYWQRVYLDEMTSLPNRRALDERIEALGNEYAIAMIDVDHFKKFNDTYGHDQGDDVLRLVAKTLESVLGNKVYRYGGEEFAAVFGRNTLKNSKDLVEKAREKLAQTKFTVRSKTPARTKRSRQDRGKGGGKKVSVTISAGVSYVNLNADTPEKVIKLADNALYKAKKKGRNCVVVAA